MHYPALPASPPSSSRPRWARGAALASLLGAVALTFAACSSNNPSPAAKGGNSPATVNLAASSAPTTVHISTVLLTGEMIQNTAGPTQGPKFVPSDLTVPKGSKVVLTIYSYDDGTAPFADSNSPYTQVTGGAETSNGATITSLPNAQIAHTFTVPGLGLNAVIPAGSNHSNPGEYKPAVVTFTFTASKSGTFTWQCMAPCGSGSDGMGGAMATDGYMKGTLTVA